MIGRTFVLLHTLTRMNVRHTYGESLRHDRPMAKLKTNTEAVYACGATNKRP